MQDYSSGTTAISAKLQFIQRKLADWKDNQERVLIFSEFVSQFEDIKREFKKNKYQVESITGDTSAAYASSFV